jgi:23S rRNA pseudouridine1911/1915/1917 synthase
MPSPYDDDFDDQQTYPEEPVTLAPDKADTGLRLDRFLALRFPDFSRTFLQRVLESGGVTVDGVERQRSFKVTSGQRVEIVFPEIESTALLPESMELSIVFENDDVLVIDKPAGLVVHPAPGHDHGTLVNGLLHYFPDWNVAGTNRPGIVHRLDRDTSGLIVVAKTERGHSSLTEQWASQEVDKRYLALVRGNFDEERGTVDAPIARNPQDRQRMAVLAGGRPAVTHFTVLERFQACTLLETQIVTGRTHQIRVHMQFIEHPIVGDPVYNRYTGQFGGKDAIVARQFLHAWKLTFRLPAAKEVSTFEAPLPADLAAALDGLRSDETAGANA